jgi:hypothetical protein
MVTDGLPWKAQSVEDRLDKLEKAARAAKLLHDNNQEDEYATDVAKLYNALRATWERGLETSLSSALFNATGTTSTPRT